MSSKINAKKISDLFYDVFLNRKSEISIFEYLENSYCDESGIINVEKNSYTLVKQVPYKYISPTAKGKYEDFYKFYFEYVIYEKDRHIFDDLMNPNHIEERLINSKTPNFRFEHMKVRIQNGNYRYVEVALLRGEENGIANNDIHYYVFDVHNQLSREKGLDVSEQIARERERDNVTGLYIEKAFIQKCESLFDKKDKNYAVISIDIEHFTLFDEWYGRETGNFLLARIGSLLEKETTGSKGIAGYFGQDDFAFVIPFNLKKIQKIFNETKDIISTFGSPIGFSPAFGICKFSDAKDFIDALDKSSIATYQARDNLKERIHLYNNSYSEQSEKDYRILMDVTDAIKNKEITFYLQPQCRISTKMIVGAEALCRWIKKDGTIISPMEFIPVFEKYGFITELDKYIWEEVCKYIKERLDNNELVVPISVNVSHVDIANIDIADFFIKMCDEYQIPHHLIKIEITESAYAETQEVIIELVDKLRKEGFIVLMDDFGSGYSSLNMFSNLKIDVIKLDALFLKIKENDYSKGIRILESVINMAKQISVPIIVEGVEDQNQSDFLENLGCRYVQGYHFYRPMSKEDFNKLLVEKNIDSRGFIVKANEQFRLREFLDENIYSDSMLNSILGAVGLYTWDGDKAVDIVRFNQQFYQAVNDKSDFQERLENIQRWMPKEDAEVLYKTLNEAIENKLNGSQGIFRFLRTDGIMTSFKMKFYYLGLKANKHFYYSTVENITSLTELQEQMRLISEYSIDTIVFIRKIGDNWHFEVAAHGLAEKTGLSREEFENGLNDKSLYNHLSESDAKKIKQIVHAFINRESFALNFQFICKDGKKLNLRLSSRPVHERANNVQYIVSLAEIE